MNIVLIMIVGSLAGLLGAVFQEARGPQRLENFCLGILGAFAGGFIFKNHPVETFAFWGNIAMAAFLAGTFVFIFGFFPKHIERIKAKPALLK